LFLLRKTDWLWVLLFPLYLILGTFRHEAAHALMARAQGAEIIAFTFWPSFGESGDFYFGYVIWRGSTTWLTLAAPYFQDVLTYLACGIPAYYCRFRRHWVWLNLVIIGLISPLVNSGYNYLFGSDVRKLLVALPDLPVHGFFLLGLGLGLLGLMLVFTSAAQTRAKGHRNPRGTPTQLPK
jgi:hypothetical protein